MSQDRSEHYIIRNVIELPLAFCRDGYYRVGGIAECRTCHKTFKQIVRTGRWQTAMGIALNTPRPRLNDETIVAGLMLKACKNGIGNPKQHSRECPIGRMPKNDVYILESIKSDRKR